jgi:hypothetical protein
MLNQVHISCLQPAIQKLKSPEAQSLMNNLGKQPMSFDLSIREQPLANNGENSTYFTESMIEPPRHSFPKHIEMNKPT